MGDNCLSCMACFHWCPEKAIWMHTAEASVAEQLSLLSVMPMTLQKKIF